MKQVALLLAALLCVIPRVALAQHHHPSDVDVNVNSRYIVDKVSIDGIDDSDVSKSLRADMQKLVGEKYDLVAANELAHRLRSELPDCSVDIRLRRGETPDHVKVVFEVEKNRSAVDVQAGPIVYHSTQAFSLVVGPDFETHHNYVGVFYVNTVDELLERNEGWRLRYEHHRVGTPKVQVGVGYDYFHPTFYEPTLAALSFAPAVPPAYRIRQEFSSSVSVLPVNGVKLTGGVSLDTLDFDVPTPHVGHAFSFTFDANVHEKIRSEAGYRQEIIADYSLRRATPTLQSDFEYTRHLVAADYTISVGRRHLFGFHGRLGRVDGAAPLFERFSIGDSTLLRGWNKFDVDPIGGSRLAYGSLEYRYRPFQIFWDFGSVWDPIQPVSVHHGIGAGLVWKNVYMSLAFPVRLHDVSPVFIFGVRW